MKKIWKKPEITILTDSLSEEAVLSSCKTAWNQATQAGAWNDFGLHCYNLGTTCTVACSALAAS